VAARDPEVENPHQGISLYLVEADRAGFARGKQLDKMGLRAQDTTELFFNDCRIPAGNRLGEKGWGFLMLMQKLQQERLITALMAQAAAGYILDTTTAFLKETIISGRPLTKSQSVQFALVEMATELRLGQTFVDKLAADHMEGKEIITETSMAKYWVTDMVWRTANRCLELYRDAGMLESCPIVRALRDVRVMSIFAGTNEIMKGIAAKFMLLKS
jgi:acyl-CoA dehydrogenase